MTRRRRASVDALTIIYWRDIPSQVTASVGGSTAKELLEPRFQHAIDRAAAVADLTDSDLYVAEWRRENRPIEGEAESAALDVAQSLQAEYPRERLEALVAAGGLDSPNQESDQP